MPVVLIADDDPDLLQALAEALSDQGWGVVTAASSAATIEVARSERVDVLLLDLSLAAENDRALYEGLRTHAGTRVLPVVFMTGSSQGAMETDGAFVLLKPFDVQQTVAALEGAISRNRGSARSASTVAPASPVTARAADFGDRSPE